MPEGGNRPILVTGANGHIGRRLLVRMAEQQATARAVVRSRRAAASLEELPESQRPELQIVDYANEGQLREALAGCRAAVHLVGVIKETRDAPFEAAHEQPCEALARAAESAGVEQIVTLSIVGADAQSQNACLASRGRAEAILLASPVPVTIVRVPMVIGPGDYATAALRGQAMSRVAMLVGGGATLQQPIDADDVVAALLAALERPELANRVLELGGPECLSHRQLVMRAAALHENKPSVLPIPVMLVRAFAALAARLLPNPPITPAMLGVLQHDDRVDTAEACEQLGIELTPLDATLRACVGPEPNT